MDDKNSVKAEDGTRPMILVTHPEISNSALEILEISYELVICKSIPPQRNEIIEKCQGVHGMLWNARKILIDAELLDAAGPQLKVISVLSYSCDFVDVNLLNERNIHLGHTPQVGKNTIAELAVGLFLAAAKRFHEGRVAIKKSLWAKWDPLWLLGTDIRGSVIGFFGMNKIGLTIAEHLRGFNIGKFIYTNNKYKSIKQWLIQVSFDKLVRDSHFIFIICPLTSKTKYIFNNDIFNKAAPSLILINLSDSHIIDQNALYKALNSRRIFAAAIDSFYPEPLPKHHQLLDLPNLIITPHIRTQTKKVRDEISILAAENIVNALIGKDLWSTIATKKLPEDNPEEFEF